MNSPVFAIDVRELAKAFKTLCEADEMTGLDTYNERLSILNALVENVSNYRAQLEDTTTPVFAADIEDLSTAFKTLCESSDLSNIDTYDDRKLVLSILNETIKKYRDQLKEE